MNAQSTRIALVISTLTMLGSAAVAADASFPVRHLDPTDALMAVNVRVPGLSQSCRVTPVQARDPSSVGLRGVLEVSCGSDFEAMKTKIQAALAEVDVSAPTHRFHIAVLAASRKDAPMPDVSAGETRALNDFKKVMPYKSFQIEAETILQSDRDAQTQLNGSYTLALDINPNTASGDSIDVRRLQLQAVNPQVDSTGAQSHPVYIATSFSIKKGETIVLGTSMSDQQARVVLVTALP